MSKCAININGSGFQHAISSNSLPNLFVEWVKDNSAEVSLHIDTALFQPVDPTKKNYGWLCESKTIIPDLYELCRLNVDFLKNQFKKVFTHDVELANFSNVFQLTLCSGKSFIANGEIYPKSKLLSMIASNKVLCSAHVYRQTIIEKYKSQCDHFGTGYNPLVNKEDGLKDYCFSIVMENATYPNMFTEKITDCFMTGTVPIYYGIQNIGDFFDVRGIISLNGDFDVQSLTFDRYQSMIPYIELNLKKSVDLLSAEDYIYLNYIKNYEKL